MYGNQGTSAVIIALMLLCWAAAIVLAIWGTIRDARQAEREKHHVYADALPESAWEGVVTHWGLWSIALVVIGLLLLAVASHFVNG